MVTGHHRRDFNGRLPITNYQQGSLLVIAIWLIVVLATLAVAMGGGLSTETRMMRYQWAKAQAKAWARAGVILAMQRLAQDARQTDEPYDWLGDDWAFFSQDKPGTDSTVWIVQRPVEGRDPSRFSGHVAIQIVDEERKLNLNVAMEEALAHLLGHREVARAILDYRDADGELLEATAPPSSMSQRTPIRFIEELWAIPDFNAQAQIRQALIQHTTIYTEGVININTTHVEVLAAVTGEPGLAEHLVRSRPGLDGQFGTDDDCRATMASMAANELASCANMDEEALVSLFTKANVVVRSAVFRILIVGAVHRPLIRYRVAAIVRRGGSAAQPIWVSGEPFQILAWREG